MRVDILVLTRKRSFSHFSEASMTHRRPVNLAARLRRLLAVDLPILLVLAVLSCPRGAAHAAAPSGNSTPGAADLSTRVPHASAPSPAAPHMERLGGDCDEDTTISSVSHDGGIIKTLDGHTYEVDEIDRIDTQLWLVPDDITVCWQAYLYNGRKMTLYELRHEGEKVDAQRIR